MQADYSRGGGGPPPESLGIDLYSGFRKEIQVYTFIVAMEEVEFYRIPSG